MPNFEEASSDGFRSVPTHGKNGSRPPKRMGTLACRQLAFSRRDGDRPLRRAPHSAAESKRWTQRQSPSVGRRNRSCSDHTAAEPSSSVMYRKPPGRLAEFRRPHVVVLVDVDLLQSATPGLVKLGPRRTRG